MNYVEAKIGKTAKNKKYRLWEDAVNKYKRVKDSA